MSLFLSYPGWFLPLLISAGQLDHTDALIKQMGSGQYRQREAAARALLKTGAPALGALRNAARRNPDAEIRSRASKLVLSIERRTIAEIASSKLTDQEKQSRLREFVFPGMSIDRARQLLGNSTLLRSQRSLILGGPTNEFFSASGVLISHQEGKITDVVLWED